MARSNKTVTIVSLNFHERTNILIELALARPRARTDRGKTGSYKWFCNLYCKVKGFIDANWIENPAPSKWFAHNFALDDHQSHPKVGKLQMAPLPMRYISTNHTTTNTQQIIKERKKKSTQFEKEWTMLLTIVPVAVSASCSFWSLAFCTSTSCCPFSNKVAHL